MFDATDTTRKSEEKEERVRIILRVVWKVSTVCVNRHIYFIHMYFARVVSATVPPTDIRLTVFVSLFDDHGHQSNTAVLDSTLKSQRNTSQCAFVDEG